MQDKIPLLNKLCIVEGSRNDYFALARFHYQPTLYFPPTKVYKIVGGERWYRDFPDPTAVIVFSQPFPDIESRTKSTSGFFHQCSNLGENLSLLNKTVIYLARLITDDRYLRRGIATYLLNETLKILPYPIVETLTPIDFTNRMYTKQGFEIYYQPASVKYTRLMNAFFAINIDLKDTTVPELIELRINSLPSDKREFIEFEISKFLQGFRNADRFKPGYERTRFILSKVPPPQAYLIWFNPRSKEAADIKHYRDINKSTYPLKLTSLPNQ
jgi:hypothetical protein